MASNNTSDIESNGVRIRLHTGNILTIPNLNLKTGNSIDKEFEESIKLTLEKKYGKEVETFEADISKQKAGDTLEVNGGSPFTAVSPDDIKVIRTSVKVFLGSSNPEDVRQSVSYVLKCLETQSVDNIILAYSNNNKDKDPAILLSEVEVLWHVLEDCVEEKKVSRIGVSDLHEDVFIQLFDKAKVKPSMIQINLNSCCVIPPLLQEFTKQHEIQLLTHSDPVDMLSIAPVIKLFGNENLALSWAARYQAHVMCRGVLVSKGYVVSTAFEHK